MCQQLVSSRSLWQLLNAVDTWSTLLTAILKAVKADRHTAVKNRHRCWLNFSVSLRSLPWSIWRLLQCLAQCAAQEVNEVFANLFLLKWKQQMLVPLSTLRVNSFPKPWAAPVIKKLPSILDLCLSDFVWPTLLIKGTIPYLQKTALNTRQSRIEEPPTLEQVIETGHRYTRTCLSWYHCTEPELLCTQGHPKSGQVYCWKSLFSINCKW